MKRDILDVDGWMWVNVTFTESNTQLSSSCARAYYDLRFHGIA